MSVVFVPGDDGHLASRGRARRRRGRGSARRSPPSARAARGTARIRGRATWAAARPREPLDDVRRRRRRPGSRARDRRRAARPAPEPRRPRARAARRSTASGSAVDPFGAACACADLTSGSPPARRSGTARSRAASAPPCGSSPRAAAGSRPRTPGSAPARPRRSGGSARTGTRARATRPRPDELAIEKKTTVACWPWNLSTVPIRIRRPGSPPAGSGRARCTARPR